PEPRHPRARPLMTSDDDSSAIDLGGARTPRKPDALPGSSPTLRPGADISCSVTSKQNIGSALLADLLHSCLIHPVDWKDLPRSTQEELSGMASPAELLARLVALRLLTAYQAEQIGAGAAASLLLGNYRVLDRLGAGGAGVVLKGQHLRLRRPVAIKVIPESA